MSESKTIRVKNWQEFKDLAYSGTAKSVVYIIAQSIPAGNYTGLKLILPLDRAQYIFTDSAKGNLMRRTGIPVRKDNKGDYYLTDEDVKRFLRNELKIKDLKIFSYWTA